jgi:thiamine pyrophosphate-dependent acetolactate synthase large subunit-like protein
MGTAGPAAAKLKQQLEELQQQRREHIQAREERAAAMAALQKQRLQEVGSPPQKKK